MKLRDFDPRRLDMREFAKSGAELSGEWPLTGFERLREMLVADAADGPARAARWTVQGESILVRGGAPQIWLRLRADVELPLRCQRCLQPLIEPLHVARDFQFVTDEAAAASLDNEAEHEVLVLSRELDLHELLEDELLLDLPLVPRHDTCPQPLVAVDDGQGGEPAPSPFAALAALRRGQG
jgi:uncharacterized protein